MKKISIDDLPALERLGHLPYPLINVWKRSVDDHDPIADANFAQSDQQFFRWMARAMFILATVFLFGALAHAFGMNSAGIDPFTLPLERVVNELFAYLAIAGTLLAFSLICSLLKPRSSTEARERATKLVDDLNALCSVLGISYLSLVAEPFASLFARAEMNLIYYAESIARKRAEVKRGLSASALLEKEIASDVQTIGWQYDLFVRCGLIQRDGRGYTPLIEKARKELEEKNRLRTASSDNEQTV